MYDNDVRNKFININDVRNKFIDISDNIVNTISELVSAKDRIEIKNIKNIVIGHEMHYNVIGHEMYFGMRDTIISQLY
jgi:hypothetical protein